MNDHIIPPGFSFGGIHCGIKKDGELDLALILSETPCSAAALFTQNPYAAAPVDYDRQLLEVNNEGVMAMLINSGIANAITGSVGAAATRRSAEGVEATFGLPMWSTLVMSTGVIGVQLPVEKIEQSLPALFAAIQPSGDGMETAAKAIVTTDTTPKTASVQGTVGDRQITVSGIAKGSGMIHPNMATMLAALVTDLSITPAALQRALKLAADQSFNRISVDGDTSTNDTVAIIANHLAGNNTVTDTESAEFLEFAELLTLICVSLAQDCVRDGEGASRFVTVRVSGLVDEDEAHRVANSVATSPLVKTALYGGDANWGRILAAAGNSGVAFQSQAAALSISGQDGDRNVLSALQIVAEGAVCEYEEAQAAERFAQPEIIIDLQLGDGSGQCTVWTCDLSHEYVTINGDYRT